MKTNTSKFSLIPILVNLFFLSFYYCLFQQNTLTHLVLFIPTIILFFLSGEFILNKLYIQIKIDKTLQYGFSIFIGGLANYLFLILIKWLGGHDHIVAIYFPPLLGLLYFYRHSRCYIKKMSLYYYILIILIFILSLSGGNYYESISSHPIGNLMDNYFYTSIVSSLRSGSILSTTYEINSPLNYHFGGLLWPAILSEITQITSHAALWQIFIPFLRFITLYFIAYLISTIVQLRQVKLNLYLTMLFGVLLYIGLAPINPKYLFAMDLSKILWIGTPFSLPDRPALSASLIITLFLILLLLKLKKWSTTNISIFVMLYSILIIFKVTSFFVFSLLFGCWALWKIVVEKDNTYFKLIIISLIPTSILYYLVFINDFASGVFIFKLGYLASRFGKLAGLNSSTNFFITKGFFIFLSTFAIWIGIKFIGLLYMIKKFKNKSIPLITSFILTFIFLIIFTSIFEIHVINSDLKILDNISFDLMQFFKVFILFITILSSAGFIYTFYILKNKTKYVFVIITTIYCGLIISSLISSNFPRKLYKENNWAKSVNKEVEKDNTTLLVTQPSSKYPGQLLSAYDISPWLVLLGNRIGGYITTFKNDSNRQLVNTLINANDSTTLHRTVEELSNKGVTHVVGNPDIENVLKNLVIKKLLTQKPENKWLFKLNP